MLRGNNGERHAERGVRPGRENGQRRYILPGRSVGVGYRQAELDSLRSPDPVALHDLDLLGPVDAVHVVKELLGVSGNPVEPLLHVSLLDRIARAFTSAVAQNLLISQHCLAAWTPVDRCVVAVDEARLVELQEDPLGPPDVGGVVTLHHPAPVVDGADPPQRSREGLDVGVGMDPGVSTRLDGRVLGRQTKGVEPNGRQHPVSPHGAVADQKVSHRVVANVTHVGWTARVRIHGEHVEGRSVVVVVDLIGALVGPPLLPAGLDGLGVVALGHRR